MCFTRMKPRKVLCWILFVMKQLKVLAECSFRFDSSKSKIGNFSSPNFPEKYPEDVECFYLFAGEDYETLRLSFFIFELEDPFNKGCLTDYIDISTITILNEKQLVGRFCGQQVPETLLFMHPRAEIIFKSNLVVHHQGFHGQFEFTDEKYIPPPTSVPKLPNCGGNETGVGGVITSPGYPAAFPKDVDCVWLIRVDYSQHIYIRIIQLQLYGSIANCDEAELAIIDGYSSLSFNPHLLQRYCGDLKYYKNVDDQILLSGRNRIIIRFKTAVSNEVTRDNKEKFVGFKLVWTAVNFEPTGQCTKFVCEGSQYCINAGSRTCEDTRHYCIDNSLVCDGLPNCGMEDSSDEDKCNLPFYAASAGAIGAVVLVILIAYAVCRSKSSPASKPATANDLQLRQLEHSPQLNPRHFYTQPPIHDANCSVHYDVIGNNRYGGYPTDV